MPRGIPKSGFRNTKNNAAKIASAVVSTKFVGLQKGPSDVDTGETESQIATRLAKRFDALDKMTKACMVGAARSLIVSGPAGLGKSFTVEKALEKIDEKRYAICKGFVRPTGLYQMLYSYRHENNILVFDDCDSVFMDKDALNILKAACDTTENRRIMWGAETRMIGEDGEALPRSFEFKGTVIFITNFDFDAAIQNGGSLAEHFNAMVSRSHYIDTGMKTRKDYIVRMKQVVEEGMLADKGMTKIEAAEIMAFIEQNQMRLRELTLRMVLKIAGLYRMGSDWKEMAEVTVFRNV
jgi:hypothetical protein